MGGKPNHNVHVQPIWYGLLPLYRKLYPALSPRRRRMLPQPLANDLRRERTKPYWEAIGLAQTPPIPIPHIKVLRSFFKSDRPPRSPVPPFPKNIVNPKAKPPTDVRDKNERKNPQRVKWSLDSGCGDADLPPLAARRIPRRRSERKLGAQTIREGTVLAVAGFLIRLF